MMTSLFSVFDPSSGILNLPLNWLSTFLGLIIMPYFFWAGASRWVFLWNKVLLALYSEFRALLGVYNSQVGLLFVSLFSLIVFNNFLGLFPYVFTSSSHLVMTLALSLPLWISFMIFGWFNHTQHMFAHLVPSGTPGLLMPFMVLIETISNVIRPGTLAIRLAANMVAGHLLLSLMGGAAVGLGSVILFLLLSSQILLLVLECAVAIIQSYVFAVLSTLYVSEVV